MIDLRRVQVLRVLADRGTVTATAEALHLTPSAVSQQIRLLADDLGVELLERTGRNVRLTVAAHALLRHADALHEQWERARAELAVGSRVTGTLRLCGVSSAVAALMAPAVARLRRDFPELDVHVAEEESEDCFTLLLAGQADIAVVLPTAGTPPVDDARFDQHVLHEDPQDLLVWRGHPFAEGGGGGGGGDVDGVRLSDAAAENWIVKPRHNDTYDLLLAACSAAGFTPRVTHHVKEWFAVSALVAEGFGVCLLPRLVPVPGEHPVVRVPVRGNPRPVRKFLCCVRRGSGSHPALAEGVRALRAAVGRLPG
ncbi:LysR family transcriptional regulator [Saccharomonospora cyanea]|uniref:Transcriptional regulator n=1 Tax=Saccharomonospora cyanea NA-134 TaxID=882082 RepID=H5XDX7_9PSEU|nr:LysR family transcriptional regulator [Saccharomonospora cyanea]EHR59208.1 transcriptional regulator [Saccharomonospora cyanea NA-134]